MASHQIAAPLCQVRWSSKIAQETLGKEWCVINERDENVCSVALLVGDFKLSAAGKIYQSSLYHSIVFSGPGYRSCFKARSRGRRFSIFNAELD